MDLMDGLRRRVGGWRSAPGSRVPSRGLSPTSSGSSASTGLARSALPSSSPATPPPPRTSRRRRSSPPSAISTASTGGGRSRPGCTGSSSTGRSTGRARASSAPRSSSATTTRRRPQPGLDGRRAGTHRRPAAGAPRGRRPPLRARVHAGRDRRAARPAARHRQLATAPRPRPDEGGDVRAAEEERAWEVVRRAYEERTPQPRHARSRVLSLRSSCSQPRSPPPCSRRPAAPSSSACARRSESSTPTRRSSRCPRPEGCSSSPTDGGGVWLVRDNGFKRRLGAYADAQWSPHGLFAVATTRNHLLALDEDAHVRWTLTRAGAALPRWAGSLHRHPHRLPRARAVCASSAATGAATACSTRPRRRSRRRGSREPSTSRTSRAAARSFDATRSRAPCAGGARPTSCRSRSNGRTTGGCSPSRRRRASSSSAPTAASCARSARWARPS